MHTCRLSVEVGLQVADPITILNLIPKEGVILHELLLAMKSNLYTTNGGDHKYLKQLAEEKSTYRTLLSMNMSLGMKTLGRK